MTRPPRGENDPAWMRQATCRLYEENLWHADGPNATTLRAKAIRICNTCPVQRQCLEHAIREEEPYGVWGGLEPKQRQRLIDARKRNR